MIKENVVEAMGKLAGEVQEQTVLGLNNDLEPTEKLAVSVGLAIILAYSSLYASRSLEGTVMRKHEKVLAVCGALGVAALNGLVDYNLWS